MTNMGKCACDMYTSSLFFYEKRIFGFVYETKIAENC